MNFFHTHISKDAARRVADVLETTFVSEGATVKEFEDELSAHLGIRNPVAVNSGTSALHLGLQLAGVGAGDEVILPAQTFVASGLSILTTGAAPVFADIDYETGNLDLASVRAKLSDKTKAIMPVHWAGYPCDMDELNALAEERNLAVIEDAAHALGATYKGKPVGALSDFTAFSFQAIKHLTTGDGGAIACRDAETAERAKALRWFGIDRRRAEPSILGERKYDLNEVGYKYHMNNYAAALGLANLDDFPAILARRREIGLRYRETLANVDGLRLLEAKEDRESAYWQFTVLVERREDFIRALKERGVPASVVHLRIDENSVFGGKTPGLENQERFNERQVGLPIHNGLSDEDVETVLSSIKAGW
ncbi:MAG: hypothetical protein GF419_03430 [Ignavibacteriales bacterium]|nr:hypothetical protein [Ignavibacteriales bacterium]